jgi:hypothetical protein
MLATGRTPETTFGWNAERRAILAKAIGANLDFVT